MLADARYFTHDDNARHDPKIRALIKKYGMEGYGRFWVIVENMREAKGYKLNLKSYVLDALAEQMQCKAEEVQQFINDCIKEFELFIKEEGFFYSESLLERMAKLDNLRSKRQGAAYAMHEKYHHNITRDPNEPQD